MFLSRIVFPCILSYAQRVFAAFSCNWSYSCFIYNFRALRCKSLYSNIGYIHVPASCTLLCRSCRLDRRVETDDKDDIDHNSVVSEAYNFSPKSTMPPIPHIRPPKYLRPFLRQPLPDLPTYSFSIVPIPYSFPCYYLSDVCICSSFLRTGFYWFLLLIIGERNHISFGVIDWWYSSEFERCSRQWFDDDEDGDDEVVIVVLVGDLASIKSRLRPRWFLFPALWPCSDLESPTSDLCSGLSLLRNRVLIRFYELQLYRSQLSVLDFEVYYLIICSLIQFIQTDEASL